MVLDLLFAAFVVGAILFLCGAILLFVALRGTFVQTDTGQEITVFNVSLKLSTSIFIILLIMISGAFLMVPKLYLFSTSSEMNGQYANTGYSLCDFRPYSLAGNIVGGPDDQTKAVLQSLMSLPSNDSQQLSQWGLQFARLLKEDREVLEALQSAIVRSNYRVETIIVFCRASSKTEGERTGEENVALETINSAMGVSQ